MSDYSVIEPRLIEAELKGRAWVHARAQPGLSLPTMMLTPTDDLIRALHLEMFGGFLPWAGTFRRKDVGPSGIVNVPWPEVPIHMRQFSDDLGAWVAALPPDPGAAQIAEVVADAHARFQWVHPFEDTNGRTGRVLDLFLLWVTFGLAKEAIDASPILDPFPSDELESHYYAGLQAADAYRPEQLRAYYTDRVVAALGALTHGTTGPVL